MKKIIIPILVAVSLSACVHDGGARPDLGVAPPAKMPELPPQLNRKAERLPDITDRSLGGVTRDGINSDMRYNDLAFRYNAIVDAWACVRESLNNRSTDNLNHCFSGAGPAPATGSQPK